LQNLRVLSAGPCIRANRKNAIVVPKGELAGQGWAATGGWNTPYAF